MSLALGQHPVHDRTVLTVHEQLPANTCARSCSSQLQQGPLQRQNILTVCDPCEACCCQSWPEVYEGVDCEEGLLLVLLLSNVLKSHASHQPTPAHQHSTPQHSAARHGTAQHGDLVNRCRQVYTHICLGGCNSIAQQTQEFHSLQAMS